MFSIMVGSYSSCLKTHQDVLPSRNICGTRLKCYVGVEVIEIYDINTPGWEETGSALIETENEDWFGLGMQHCNLVTHVTRLIVDA